jgi:iron complex outermembrane receptor protein
MSRADNNKRAVRAGLMAGVAAAILFATPAAAQARQRFNLSAGDAAQRVQTLAIQSRVQVIAPNADLAGVTTRPVNGEYTPAEALRLMLAGSGLEATPGTGNTLVIRRAAQGVALAADLPSEGQGSEAGVGLAQEEADREIVVTGSRIRRPGFDTLEATLVTDREQFERRAFTNVSQALEETPGFVPSGVNPVGTGQGTFNAGQSFADFFGLGSQRTLTLVNGRRFVSSSTVAGSGSSAAPGQQVDLNLIPAGLVERVETIAIGGAPVYGSDAIAGTVNVILRDDFEGLRLTGQYGITEEGDGQGYTLRALGGLNFAEGRGNIAVGIEYNQQDGLRLSERTGSYVNLPNPTGGPPSNIVATDLVFGTFTPGGLPYNPGTFQPITDAAGNPLQFGVGGRLIPFVQGEPIYPIGSTFSLFSNGGDGLRRSDIQTLLAPTERLLVSAIGHYDITPSVRFFTEATYGHSRGEELAELAAAADLYQFGTFIPISADNAFLTPETRATILANGTDEVFVARDLSDVLYGSGAAFENTINVFRIVGGFSGDFQLFGEGANWDVSLNYGRSRARTSTARIDNDRFLEAVDAVRVNGQIVCASGNAACVPLDIFGVGQASPEAAAYVTDVGEAVSTNSQLVATANLSGALPFRLATDAIRFNIGAEYRRERGEFDPGPLLSRPFELFGFTYGSAYVGVEGEFDTREVYGELSVPIVSAAQDWPVIKSLTFEGSLRYVDNSIAGGDVTWAAGGRFEPRLPGLLDGLLVRGVYTRSIRSPAITELFSGASPVRGGISDPCSSANFDEGPNPTVREANCRAALQAFGLTPETFNPTTFALSAQGTISGNPDLENERARSWSVGVVYQPPRIPGLRLAVDLSHIDLTGGIQSLGIGTLIAACYDSANFPNEPACESFRRLESTEVGAGSANPTRVTADIANGYRSGYFNVSSLEFEGIIVLAEYGFNVGNLTGGQGPGRIQFGAKGLNNRTYIVQTTASSPRENQVGSVGLPEWSAQLNASYADDRFDVLVQALWTDSVLNDINATSEDIEDRFNRVDDYWRWNLTVGFRIRDNYRLQFVVNNLFDTRPSDAQLFSGSYGTYDLLGRRFIATATIDF